MKAGEIEFLSYLEGSNKSFVVPVYQRNYNWKKEQCKRLFDDLEDIIDSG
ncbi:GmrSD restriction endonuclease domain-containing protein, partial [Clostridioides difficile]